MIQLAFIDLSLVDGGVWTVRIDQVAAVTAHKYVRGVERSFQDGALVRLCSGVYEQVKETRDEVLQLLGKAAAMADGYWSSEDEPEGNGVTSKV